MVSIAQDEQTISLIYKKVSIMGLLAYFGSSAISVVAILRLVMINYATFKYFMDALKSLYFEGHDPLDSAIEDSWRPELSKKFRSRISFN
mmetsp:Transcript_23145/g.30846  ORF Transcript_23145/g.30846 Transcript_23145/m.30846 type:complete len:90 (+) Transcript_23145:1053-1322(+)